MNKNVNKHADELFLRFPELKCISEDLHSIYSILQNVFFNSGTLFVCGNGGSACDGEHIAGELMKCFRVKRKMPAELSERFERILGPEENIANELETEIVTSTKGIKKCIAINDGFCLVCDLYDRKLCLINRF